MKDIFFSTALYYSHFLLVLDVCVILLKFKIVHNFTNRCTRGVPRGSCFNF